MADEPEEFFRAVIGKQFNNKEFLWALHDHKISCGVVSFDLQWGNESGSVSCHRAPFFAVAASAATVAPEFEAQEKNSCGYSGGSFL